MINVKICYDKKKFVSLLVNGHANQAPKGQDLVCSAVSAVVIGSINNLNDVKEEFDISVKSGDVQIKAKKEISYHNEIVIETLITGLKTIEETNPKAITINEEN